MSQQTNKSKIKAPVAKHEANQFLLDKFYNLKRSSEMRGQKNQSFCYIKIIKSLQKYPLPLMNGTFKNNNLIQNQNPNPKAQQALQLDGVGDKMAALIGKTAKEQYKEYLQNINQDFDEAASNPDDNIINQDPEQYLNENSNSNKNITILDNNGFNYQLKRPNSLSQQPEYNQNELEQRKKMKDIIDIDEESKNFIEDYTNDLSRKTCLVDIKNENDIYYEHFSISKLISQKKQPKVEVGSTQWSILITLHSFQIENNKKFASKKELRDHSQDLKNIFQQIDIKNWATLQTLKKRDLIVGFEIDNQEKIGLTEDGKKIAENLYETALSRQNEVEIVISDESSQQALVEVTNIQQKKQRSQNGVDYLEAFRYNKNLKTIKEQHIMLEEDIDSENNDNTTCKTKDTTKQGKLPIKETKLHKKYQIKKSNIQDYKIILALDTREIREKSERDFIQTQLKQKYSVECEVGNLSLGDFLWIIEIQELDKAESEWYILDCIIERKTADDLACSILDGRYKEQKYRLKQSKIPHAYYLIEGKVTKNAQFPQQTVDNAILNTQIVDGFKVKQTENMQETIKWISFMSAKITKSWSDKIKNLQMEESIDFDQTFKDFLYNNTKQGITNIHNQFGMMIRSIKGFGQEGVNQVLSRFSTPIELFSKINEFNTLDQRVNYIIDESKNLLEKSKSKSSYVQINTKNISRPLARSLAILFGENVYPYEEVIKED